MKICLEPSARKGFTDIYTEGVVFVSAPDALVTEFGLREDCDIPLCELSCFAVAVNLHLCRLEAYKFLSRKSLTEQELSTRLREKGFISETILTILEIFKLKGMIDDLAFARDFVSMKSRSKLIGPRRLQQEMRLRGLESRIINEVLAEFHEVTDETALAEETLERRYLRLNKPRQRQKIYLFLVRKGFTPEIAGKLAGKYDNSRENRDDEDEEQQGDPKRFF